MTATEPNITYLKGDATAPKTPGRKIIAHICNDIGAWGAGFVLAISKRWKEPEKAYRTWYRTRDDKEIKAQVDNGFGSPFELGEVQFVHVDDDLMVANMIGQRGIGARSTGSRGQVQSGPPIRYDAVAKAFDKVCEVAKTSAATVHIPRIGCGLAGGTWDEIGKIVNDCADRHEVKIYVYDF